MAREKYYLFVDEVKPTNYFKIYNFTGVAIKESDYEHFKNEFNIIKDVSISRIDGAKHNLHFSNLINRRKDTPYETLTLEEEKSLWNGLGDLFNKTNYFILSGIVNQEKHNIFYPYYRVQLENLAFKALIQNFVRFLHIKNGYGEVIVESSNDDEKLREDYYINKFTGGKYITSQGYNMVLRGIKFSSKNELIEGLQLADFMANPISRLVSNMKQFKLHKFYSMSYEDIIKMKIFDGNLNNPFEFGVKNLYE